MRQTAGEWNHPVFLIGLAFLYKLSACKATLMSNCSGIPNESESAEVSQMGFKSYLGFSRGGFIEKFQCCHRELASESLVDPGKFVFFSAQKK